MNRRVPSLLQGLRAASGLIEIITLFTALTLDDEHAVAVAVKPVVFADGLSVGFFDEIQTGEGGDHHQQGRPGKMEGTVVVPTAVTGLDSFRA